jgi:hypothetical protein
MDLKTIFLFLINFLKFSNDFYEKQQDWFMIKNASNETSLCIETIYTYYNLYKLDLQVILNIGFSVSEKYHSNRSIEQFFRLCHFKYIEFQYSLETSDFVYKREEKLNELGINELKNFNYSFIDLKPLRTYYFSYGLVKLINETKYIYPFFSGDKRIKIKTCFGQPGPPDKLNHRFVEEDFLIYWKPPLIANAPYVCYFEIVLIKKKGSMTFMNTTKFYFRFKRSDLIKVKSIEIYAVNSIKCYGSRSNCNSELFKSDKEVIEMNQSDSLINNESPIMLGITTPITDGIYSNKAFSIKIISVLYILSIFLIL